MRADIHTGSQLKIFEKFCGQRFLNFPKIVLHNFKYNLETRKKLRCVAVFAQDRVQLMNKSKRVNLEQENQTSP